MNLLAVSTGLIIDIVFFVLLAVGLILGLWRGFVKGICKLAGTMFAVVFAVSFCVPMKNFLDKTFGLTEALGGTQAAGWGAIAISFVVLVVLLKLVAWLTGKAGTALVNKFGAVKILNKILGAVLGVAKALLLILIILAIFKWVGVASINDYIAQSSVVSKLFFSDWFANAFVIPI